MQTTKEKLITKCYTLAVLAFILLICAWILGLKNSKLKDTIDAKQLKIAELIYSGEVLAESNAKLQEDIRTQNDTIEKLREFAIELRTEVTRLSSEYDQLVTSHENLKNELIKSRELIKKNATTSLFSKKTGNLNTHQPSETCTVTTVTKADTEVEPKKKSKLSKILPWNWFRKKK